MPLATAFTTEVIPKVTRNSMKPMNQNQLSSSKSKFLALLLAVPFLVMSSQFAHATFTNGTLAQWDATDIVVGDKIYNYIDSTFPVATLVNAEEVEGIHSFNITRLSTSVNNAFLKYSIHITDATNYFYYNRTSENDVLNNVTGGSTTTVYSDAAFSSPLNTTNLLATQQGTAYQTNGCQTFYVKTVITNVNGAANKISNITFDVTQLSDITPVPEVTSSFTLCGLISGGFLLRRRTKRLR